MPKVYRCDKTNEEGDICNETDPQNFTEGRYNTCKKCRSKFMEDYNKQKKDEKQNKKANTVDPDNRIRTLIKDTISDTPIIKNLPKVIHKLEKDISEECLNFNDKITKFEEKISSLENENIALKLQLVKFKEYIQKILNEKL
jgi:hypothetical protein